MKTKIVFLFLFAPLWHFAQSSDTLSLSQIIEDYLKLTSWEKQSFSVDEFFEQLAKNKIDMNTADYIEFAKIPFLSYGDISKIIEYRKRKGKFISTNQLSEAGLSDYVIAHVRPFLSVGSRKESFNSLRKAEANFRLRNLGSFGKIENISILNSKTYARIIANCCSVSGSVLAEKDVYEKNVFDFVTANLLWQPKNLFVRKILAGSFSLQFGQGLVFWSPYVFSKSGDIKTSSVKSGELLIPYKSSNESLFFRGAATSFGYSHFGLTFFYSSKMYDARVEAGRFYSIDESGVHVDENDFSHRNALNVKVFGGVAAYKNKNVRVSFLVAKNIFSNDLVNISTGNITGRNVNYFSLETKLRVKKAYFTGEAASNGKGFAQFYSVQLRLTPKLFTVLSYRNYSPEYLSPWAGGFGEYGKTNNEKGFYAGAVFGSRMGRFAAYSDFYSTVSACGDTPFPVSGEEYLFEYLSPKFSGNRIGLRIKNEKKERYVKSEHEETERLGTNETSRIRFYVSTKIGKRIKIKTQIDFTTAKKVNRKTSGYALSETIVYKTENLALFIFASSFSVEDFSSRIYLYEYDLDGVFTNAVYYGEGMRYYVAVKYNITSEIKLNFKFGETYKKERVYLDEDKKFPVRTFGLQLEFSPDFKL